MGDTWITNLQHFLDGRGALAQHSPSATKLAAFFAEIVSQATDYDEPTTLQCRRWPKHRRCKGILTIFFDADTDNIIWFCPLCNDNGVISGWQDTFWDRGSAHNDARQAPS